MTTIEQIIDKHRKVCNEAFNLIVERGKEYANEDDELKTFKAVGVTMSHKPSEVAFLLLSIKYHRIMEQISKNKIPRDSFRDLINYCVLTELLLDQELTQESC
jgi:hypothetical protein